MVGVQYVPVLVNHVCACVCVCVCDWSQLGVLPWVAVGYLAPMYSVRLTWRTVCMCSSCLRAEGCALPTNTGYRLTTGRTHTHTHTHAAAEREHTHTHTERYF